MPLLKNLSVTAMYQVQGLIDLGQMTDHGQHNTQIPQPLIRFQHGPDLGEKYFRMIQSDSNSTPP